MVSHHLLYTTVIALTCCLLQQSIAQQETCEIVGCCLDDCCSEGTSWDINIQYRDPESDGFNGTHLANYEEGCMSRQCCGTDCCRQGTRYDKQRECCVPIDTSTIQVDFVEAAPDNVVLLESFHYIGDVPTIEVTASEEAQIFVYQGVNAFKIWVREATHVLQLQKEQQSRAPASLPFS